MEIAVYANSMAIVGDFANGSDYISSSSIIKDYFMIIRGVLIHAPHVFRFAATYFIIFVPNEKYDF